MGYSATCRLVMAAAVLVVMSLLGVASADVIKEGMMPRDEFPFHVRCEPIVPFTYFQEGVPTTMADVCESAGGVNTLSVTMETVAMGDWIVTFVLEEQVDGVTLTNEFPTQAIAMTAGNTDITDSVKTVPVTVPTTGQPCGDREIGISLQIAPVSGDGNTYMTKPKMILVICDFTGVDLLLSRDVTAPQILQVDDGVTPPPGLQELLDVTYTASAPSTLPTLANDAPYFIAAFLQRENMNGDVTYVNDQCGMPSSDGTTVKRGPELELGDILVGYLTFKAADDLTTFDAQMTTWLENVAANRIGEQLLCGDYIFVALIEPMHTLPDEDRCNNFLTIQVYFQCPSESAGSLADRGPKCSVIPNPFRAGKDSPFFYEGHFDSYTTRDRRIFKYEDSWKEDSPDNEHWGVEIEGYARLAMLGRYAKDLIDDGTYTCPLPSEPIDVSDVEGTEIDQTNQPTATYADFSLFQQAMGDIKALKSGATPGTIKETAVAKLGDGPGALPQPTVSSLWTDIIDHNLARGAYNISHVISAMLDAGESQDTITEHLNMALREGVCMLSHEITMVKYYLEEIGRMETDIQEMKEKRSHLDVFLNVTGGVEAIKEYLGLPNDCLDMLLLRTMDMIIAYTDATDSSVQVDDSFLYGCGYRELPCLRTSRRACNYMYHYPGQCRPATEDDRKLLCELKIFIQLMKRIARPIGLHDIRRRIHDNGDDGHSDGDYHGSMPGEENMLCADKWTGDVMKIEKDIVQLWKNDNGVFKRGELNFRKDVCWKDVAVCRCDKCTPETPVSGVA